MSLLKRILGGRPAVVPTHLDSVEAFENEVLKSELPVIVDAWSDNCAPCKRLAPVIQRVATKYDGRVRVAEFATGGVPELAMKLRIAATPTILVFKDGKEFGRMVGARPEGWFDEMIKAEFPED